MRTLTRRWIGLSAAVGLSALLGGVALAEDELSVTLLPARYAGVEGAAKKFQAQHWMKTGYAGGVQEFSAHHDFANGTALSAEGHAIVDQHDLGTEIALKREGLGFLTFDLSTFRKYYDNTGGVMHTLFTQFQHNETDKDLHLDIGKAGVEGALTLERLPAVAFSYEREFKGGTKSRLTWGPVTEAGITRRIAPSWQEIDEKVDTFVAKASPKLFGFDTGVEQRWEFVRSETLREERSRVADSSDTANGKLRRQDQAPQANLATSTVTLERNFLNNKVFVAGAYRFGRLDGREFETIKEFDANGNPRSFSNSEQKPNSRADNTFATHTWTGNVMVAPWKWLSVGTKAKAEVLHRRSNSIYNLDSTDPPDGLVNTSNQNITDNKGVRVGEGVSIRCTALPKTALYSELELEQARILLREDQKGLAGTAAASSTNNFSRESVTKIWRGVGTLGARATPWRFLDLTTQLRRRVNNNDYDDQRESAPGSSTARSAFVDGQSVHTDEWATRVTVKPWPWFRPSVRYQLRSDKYASRAESESLVKTETLSHTYTVDAILQPLQDLLVTMSWSRQTAWTKTPARYAAVATNTPTFNANVNTWLLSTDYALPRHPHVTLTGAAQYSVADNFNDLGSTQVPYGADFERLDLRTGLAWSPNPDTTLKGEYGYYHYNANDNVEFGDYNAHVIWLEAARKF